MNGLGGIDNINNVQSIIDNYKLNLKHENVKDSELEKLSKVIISDNDDYVISPEKENSLFIFKTLSIFEDSIYSEFKDIEGDEFVKVRKSLKITFEEIWKKNQTLPPAKEKEEVVKKEKEIRDFSSKKVVSNIVDFSKSLYKYVKHNEFEKNDKEVSEKDFGVWALENVVKGFEKAQAKLGSLYKADENLSVMIDETFKKSYEEIENYFIKEDTHSKEEITGIDEKHLSFFEASKEYTGIFIFE